MSATNTTLYHHENEAPAVYTTGETVKFGGRTCTVIDVYYNDHRDCGCHMRDCPRVTLAGYGNVRVCELPRHRDTYVPDPAMIAGIVANMEAAR